MPLPPAPGPVTLVKSWRYGFVIDLPIIPGPNPPSQVNSYRVYINGNSFKEYPKGQFSDSILGTTRILVFGFPVTSSGSNLSVQVSYVRNGQESLLSAAITVNTRRVEPVSSAQEAEEIEIFN